MGVIVHRTIIVNGFNFEHVGVARATAAKIFAKHGFPGLVTGLYEHAINGDWTFMVVPDGSKEGWEDSDRGDLARNEFIEWMNEKRKYVRGAPRSTMFLTWVEVVLSDDGGPPRIERFTEKGAEE